MKWLWVILGAAFQDSAPIPTEELQGRLLILVEANFGESNPAQRQDLVRRLLTPFLSAASSLRVRKVLDVLPQAVEYHSDRVRSRALSVAGTPENLERVLSTDGELRGLLVEGYEIQADYLAARIDRGLTVESSDVSRAAVRDQIRQLSSTAAEILKNKLPGPDSAAYVDRTVETWKQAWIGSLENPLSAFLDGPIPAEDLRGVLDGMRQAAVSFPSLVLGPSDLSHAERLDELNVVDLVRSIRERAYKVGKICYRNYDTYETRSKEWKARFDATRFALSEVPGGKLREPRPKDDNGPSAPDEAQRIREPSGPDAIRSQPSHRSVLPHQDEKASSSRNSLLLVLGVLIAAGAILVLVLRRKSSPL